MTTSTHNGHHQQYRLASIQAGRVTALTLLDLPAGATLSDGQHRARPQAGANLDITRWRHDNLILSLPAGSTPPPALNMLALTRQGGQAGNMKRSRHVVALTALPDATASTLTSSQETTHAALWLTGLPRGALLSDGLQRIESSGEQAHHELTGWHLDQLTVQPPRGHHRRMTLRVHVGEMSEAARKQLGELQLRLTSPNAYLTPEIKKAAHPSLPKMDIVVGKLGEVSSAHAGPGHASVRVQAASGRVTKLGSASHTATDQHARMQGFKVLDDEELADLERKMRG